MSEYKYWNSNLTKYNQSDGKTVLDPEDDAATQIMGEGWRMPTQSEFQELIDNTNKEWTTINGVNGYKFTSIKEGYQNNSIFIPAAGDGIDGSVGYVGSNGYVWSSSLYTSNPKYAWYLYFYSDNCRMSNFYRYYGKPVRGVRK